MPTLTAAAAAVETPLRHGLDAIDALPGPHNDPLFGAFRGARAGPRVYRGQSRE